MKKILIMLMALILSFSLLACGDNAEKSDESTDEETTTQEDFYQDNYYEAGEFSTAGTIEETTVVDEQGFKIVAKSLEYSVGEATLNLYVENNGKNKISLHSQCGGLATDMINRVCVSDGYINEDVEAGMKSNIEVDFDFDELEKYGIYEIGEISLGIYVTNEETNNDIFEKEAMVIKTSAFDNCDFSKDTILEAINNTWKSGFGINIVKQSSEKIASVKGSSISTALCIDDDGEKTICFDIVNTSNELLYLASDDIVVNGITVSGGTWTHDKIPVGGRSLLTYDIDRIVGDEFKSIVDENNIGSFAFTLVKRSLKGGDDLDKVNISFSIDESVKATKSTRKACYNADGITITPLDATEDEYGYDFIIPLQIENNSGKDYYIDDDYDSLYINGYAIDCIGYYEEINSGGIGVFSIEISNNDSLAKNGISSISDIKSVKIKLELRDKESYFDEKLIDVAFDY